VTIKLTSGSAFDAQFNETNTANRNYYLPDQNSGLGLTLMTSQALSGASVDFTGIPSWAKRITVMVDGYSTTSGDPIFQIGSGSIVTTGYLTGRAQGQTTVAGALISNHIGQLTSWDYSAVTTGVCTLMHMGSNKWVAVTHSQMVSVVSGFSMLVGSITLGGPLDRVRFSCAGTFDAGTINVMYE
jgi:hypothetical protein